jgi:multiple antibiotic resistance protein
MARKISHVLCLSILFVVLVLLLTTIAAIASALSPAAPANSSGPPASTSESGLSLGMIFTAFMVMLGPVKIVAPFAKLTSELEEKAARVIASKAFAFACAGGIVAAVVGQSTLVSWGISPPTLHLTAGIILLLVALKTVLAQYDSPNDTSGSIVAPRNLALTPLAFPTILTPHGIATFILLLALTRDRYRDAYILLLFFVVMAINWIVMRYARKIMRRGGIALAILGAILGVLQVSLGLKMILEALRSMHLFPSL